MKEKRTAELKRTASDPSGDVDEVAIGGWFYLEMMSREGRHFVYNLNIGDTQFSVSVPKDPSKPVEVTRVE